MCRIIQKQERENSPHAISTIESVSPKRLMKLNNDVQIPQRASQIIVPRSKLSLISAVYLL